MVLAPRLESEQDLQSVRARERMQQKQGFASVLAPASAPPQAAAVAPERAGAPARREQRQASSQVWESSWRRWRVPADLGPLAPVVRAVAAKARGLAQRTS